MLETSIAQKIDILPFLDEFEKKKRISHPSMLQGQKSSDVTYAFCNFNSMTPATRETFIVDGIPSLDLANECRDYFITKVYGMYRLALNTTSTFDNEVSPTLANRMDKVVEDCVQKL